jgi:hypothetical protein
MILRRMDTTSVGNVEVMERVMSKETSCDLMREGPLLYGDRSGNGMYCMVLLESGCTMN